MERTLRQQNYAQLARQGKGLVRRYVAKMTGLSRAQSAPVVHELVTSMNHPNLPAIPTTSHVAPPPAAPRPPTLTIGGHTT